MKRAIAVLVGVVSIPACTSGCGGEVVEEVPARQAAPRPPPTTRVVLVTATPTPSRRQYTKVTATAASSSQVIYKTGTAPGDDQPDVAIVGDCRAPTAATSCDSLRTWYMANAPKPRAPGDTDSTRTYQQVQLEKKRQTAKQILDAAAPALRLFAEADLWTHVDLPRCSATVTRDDCLSVATYITRFPDGPHAGEAHAVYDAADKKLAAKERQAAAAAAAHRAASARAPQPAAAVAPAASPAPDLDRLRAACLNKCESHGDTGDDVAMVQGCVNQCGDNLECMTQCRLDHRGTRSDRCALDCANRYGMP